MDSQESQPGKQQHQAQNPLQFQQSLQQQQHHQPPPLTVAPPHHPPQQPISYNFASNVQAHHNNSSASGSSVMPIQQPQQQSPRLPLSSMVNDTVSSAPKPNLDYSDGSSSMATGSGIEPARRKRGRPRKYSPGGNTARGLSPTPVTPISSVAPQTESGGAGTATGTASSENPSKKSRGRPPSSGKKQLDALGATGVGFIPHVITVDVGEDIVSKIMAFSQQGPRTVCILSAHGAIRDVTLRQPAHSAGILTFKGRYEIISLSGSISLSESSGSQSRTSGGLSVLLAGPDGRVLGGVAGKLMADTPVQLVVGSFIGEGKKPVATAPPSTPSSNMLNLGAAPPTGATPSSQGDSSSSDDSSDEDGGSPHSHGLGPCVTNAQPIQSVPMYGNLGWPNDITKTPP